MRVNIKAAIFTWDQSQEMLRRVPIRSSRMLSKKGDCLSAIGGRYAVCDMGDGGTLRHYHRSDMSREGHIATYCGNIWIWRRNP